MNAGPFHARRGRDGERGAVLIVGLVVILLTALMGALIVDIPIAERAGRMLQRSADAAALAGAIQLEPAAPDGVDAKLGWYRAKRAVFAFLKRNPVIGDHGSLELEVTDSGVIGSGTVDLWEMELDGSYQPTYPFNPYRFVEYAFGDPVRVRAKVERGIYVREGSDGELRFISLEGISRCTDAGLSPLRCAEIGGELTPPDADPFGYRIANGVEVTLTLDRLSTVFAKIQGIAIGEIGAISRTALAAPGIE